MTSSIHRPRIEQRRGNLPDGRVPFQTSTRCRSYLATHTCRFPSGSYRWRGRCRCYKTQGLLRAAGREKL